jgi:hypothetical protein
MDSKEITKQMINGHKAVFETGFNSMVVLQEQTSKAVDNFLKQSPFLPGPTKSIINEWTSIYKEGTMDFKKAADQNYSKLEEVLTSALDPFKPKSKN